MDEYLAFIDESGDPNFNDGASKSFFICATIFKKAYSDSIKDVLNEIRKKLGINELKSSKVNSDHRRIQILEIISRLDIKVVTVYVDKDACNGNWFRYRKTFYKFIQGKLITEVFRVFGNVQVTFDSYGNSEYQESFVKYISNKIQAELFTPQVVIGTPKIDEFLQLSDYIGGSLRKFYEGEFLSAESLLKPIWKGKLRIPEDRHNKIAVEGSFDDDEEIKRISFETVDRFFHLYRKKEDQKISCEVLEYLYQMVLEEPQKFCYRVELREWLKYIGHEISEENISRTIISELRDEGVLIASSSEGLKIPTSLHDIQEHYDLVLGQVMPSLRRLKKIDQLLDNRKILGYAKLMSMIDKDSKHIIDSIHSA